MKNVMYVQWTIEILSSSDFRQMNLVPFPPRCIEFGHLSENLMQNAPKRPNRMRSKAINQSELVVFGLNDQKSVRKPKSPPFRFWHTVKRRNLNIQILAYAEIGTKRCPDFRQSENRTKSSHFQALELS